MHSVMQVDVLLAVLCGYVNVDCFDIAFLTLLDVAHVAFEFLAARLESVRRYFHAVDYHLFTPLHRHNI